MEEWKPVVGYEAYYEVSNEGRVRTIGGILKKITKPATNGYYCASLYCPDKKHTYVPIHTLVAGAFLGERSSKEVCDHIDGNKLNNNINNLRYVPQSINCKNSSRWRSSTNVEFHKRYTSNKKYSVRMRILGKRRSFGYFSSREEAEIAALKVRRTLKL